METARKDSRPLKMDGCNSELNKKSRHVPRLRSPEKVSPTSRCAGEARRSNKGKLDGPLLGSRYLSK